MAGPDEMYGSLKKVSTKKLTVILFGLVNQ